MTYHARQMLHSILTLKRNNPARVTRAGTPGFQAVLLVSLFCTHQLDARHLLLTPFLPPPHALKGKQVEKEAHSGYCHYEPGARVHNGVRLNSNSYGVCHSSKPNCGDATPPRAGSCHPSSVHHCPWKRQRKNEQKDNESDKHIALPSCIL